MSALRLAALLLTCAASGSLAAAAATASVPAILASVAVLAVSCASCRALGLREAREVRDRIAVLGEPYAVVLAMASGGVARKAYVRGMDLAGEEEAAV